MIFFRRKKSSFSKSNVPLGYGAGQSRAIKIDNSMRIDADRARQIENSRYMKTRKYKAVRTQGAIRKGSRYVSREFNDLNDALGGPRKRVGYVTRDPVFEGALPSSLMAPMGSYSGTRPQRKIKRQRFDPSGLGLVSSDYDLL